MPKIIKTVTADGIYNDSALAGFVDSGKYFGEYNALADNGELYIIRGSSETKEWYAFKCVSPSVSDKTKFKKMLRGYEPTGETSEVFKTKKALKTACPKIPLQGYGAAIGVHLYYSSFPLSDGDGEEGRTAGDSPSRRIGLSALWLPRASRTRARGVFVLRELPQQSWAHLPVRSASAGSTRG